MCDGTATRRMTVRLAPPAAASWHAPRARRGGPRRRAIDVIDDRDGERVPRQDRLQGGTAQAYNGGETGIGWHDRIKQSGAALRQAQDARRVEGSRAPPRPRVRQCCSRRSRRAMAVTHQMRPTQQGPACSTESRRKGRRTGPVESPPARIDEDPGPVCRPCRRRSARPAGSSRQGRTCRDADRPARAVFPKRVVMTWVPCDWLLKPGSVFVGLPGQFARLRRSPYGRLARPALQRPPPERLRRWCRLAIFIIPRARSARQPSAWLSSQRPMFATVSW